MGSHGSPLILAPNERIREPNDDVVGRSREVADAVRSSGHNGCVAEDPNDGETWESEVLDNPTWLDVARVANQMLIALNDHHVYLEGIDIIERPKGKPVVAELVMGS